MFGPLDFVLGGLAPLVAAAAAYAALWAATRRPGAAWSAGVVVGYAAGMVGLEARDSGLAATAARLVHPSESHEWLPLLALAAALPATIAALAGRRWLEWALAAPLCVAAPALLLGSKYRASQQLRDAGFADDAITPTGAVSVLALVAVATLAAWRLWRGADASGLARSRSFLAIAAAVAAAAAAALTGALVFGQAFGVLAAALGGCAATAWAVGDKSGPEAARGPTLVLVAGLLAAAVVYSDLPPRHAAMLAAAMAVPVGWLPGAASARPWVQFALRAVLCVIPLGVVVWQAAAIHRATDNEELEESSDEWYEDVYVPMESTPEPQSP
jgi:hypothetical protein